ncbi:hypothetical protein SLEP1_g58897 [Rubroshorea leprosula]|uniref:Uncharacterized protein n=1 Tax=Rubroshorea leprosula TaxID=152421 RepID=A0AAV5MU07_9ROSI|nr:hypothetical protein SLEP1_g58897 [Rubroshorea leprosula]
MSAHSSAEFRFGSCFGQPRAPHVPTDIAFSFFLRTSGSVFEPLIPLPKLSFPALSHTLSLSLLTLITCLARCRKGQAKLSLKESLRRTLSSPLYLSSLFCFWVMAR